MTDAMDDADDTNTDDLNTDDLISRDIDALVEWGIATATERWTGHLIPFVGGVEESGEVVEITSPEVHGDAPEANAIIHLTTALRPHLQHLRAAAIVYRVNHDVDKDAIELSLEHQGGVARHIRRPFPKGAAVLELGPIESKDAPGAIWFEKPRAG